MWIGNVICLALIAWGSFEMICGIGRMDADWKVILTRRDRGKIVVLCVLQGLDIAWRWEEVPAAAQCLLCLLAGCLLAACLMDLWEKVVYRFVWWVSGSAAGVLLLLRAVSGAWPELYDILRLAGELILYVLIQQFLFGRMYGRADCHAFCVCAVAQSALGGGFRDYVIHMAAAFLGLAAMQIYRKNIASDGNLKVPVPFLPYITLSFWLWVDFMAGKWYI